MSTELPQQEAWHFDKRVPIALIVTIVLQTGLAVSWMTSLANRVDGAAEANIRQDARITSMEAVMNDQAVNAATFAAQLTAVRESLLEVKTVQVETNRLIRDLTKELSP